MVKRIKVKGHTKKIGKKRVKVKAHVRRVVRDGSVSGWKKGVSVNGWVYFETKRRSKVYKGQPYKEMVIQPHPMDKEMWTINHGQAPISMPKIKSKAQALKYVKDYMKEHPRG